MQISNHLTMLEVKVPRGNSFSTIYPSLAWDDKHLVLFDAGYPDSAEYVFAAIREAGFEPKDITDLILTHQDVDHIGGAREILKVASNARVHAHIIDADFIEGSKVPTKLDGLEKKKAAGEFTAADEPFYNMLKNGFPISYVKVDEKLENGDLLDFCGGIEVIFTPGHTPGHASYYLKESKTIIAGDAANIHDGVLVGSNPAMTWDLKEADKSLEKIKGQDLTGLISYHTGYIKF